jgi:hypothetical protein
MAVFASKLDPNEKCFLSILSVHHSWCCASWLLVHCGHGNGEGHKEDP